MQIVKEVIRYSVSSEGEKIGIISNEIVDKSTGEVFSSYLLSEMA